MLDMLLSDTLLDEAQAYFDEVQTAEETYAVHRARRPAAIEKNSDIMDEFDRSLKPYYDPDAYDTISISWALTTPTGTGCHSPQPVSLHQASATLLKRNPTAPWLLRLYRRHLTAWLLVNQTIAAQEAEFQDRLSFPVRYGFLDQQQPVGLEPEEIDRAVLNRLMQEIASAPQRTASITGLEAETLEKILSLCQTPEFY